MKHADLIARLEKLTGPDREVDAEIANAVDPRWWTWQKHYGPGGAERLTASLDDAVALVERMLPGWGHQVGRPLQPPLTPIGPSGYYGTVFRERQSGDIGVLAHMYSNGADGRNVGQSPTPAIALLIALLRALQESNPA